MILRPKKSQDSHQCAGEGCMQQVPANKSHCLLCFTAAQVGYLKSKVEESPILLPHETQKRIIVP
jgi:hypothetical protein